jgi:hypothetical protein
VLAIIHEVCRRPGVFPQSPDDLWITDTGEVLVAQSDRATAPIDPRSGVAALLDAMLPSEPEPPLERQVSESLRGLSSRLRVASAPGAKDRRDLMNILMWHTGAEPRDVIARLAGRLRHPQPHADANPAPAAIDDLDLFDPAPNTTPPAPTAPAARTRRPRVKSALALVGAGVLMISVGYASYRLFRGADAATETGSTQAAAPAPIEPPPVAAADKPRVTTAAAVQPIRIEMPGGAFSPAFGPTRGELFFHAGRTTAGRLLVARFDDSGRVASINPVIEEGARNYHPRVSPDGQWIAFDSDREGERGVYIMDRDGAAPRRVSGRGYAAVPSWSPDMKWLAFIRGEPSRPRVWNLWLRDVQSGALTRYTSFRAGQVWGASWFPDGRSLAYSHEDRLIVSHLDGRDDIVIRSPRAGQLVRTPAVSPDGRQVVFQVFKDGVWLLDLDSRETRRILDDPSAEEFAWSPDGRQIAYHSRRDGAWRIWSTEVASISSAP